jgi:opacity protein-like surface antigen
MVIPQDVGFSANSTRGGTTTTGSGKFEFDAGYSVAALGGYKINPYVAAEAEIGYASFDYNKVTGNFTATNGGSSATVSGSAKLDGSVDSVIGLARGIVSPLGDRPIRPLIGGGVGFASTSEKINKIGTTAVSASTDHTDLALEGTVGLEADIGLSTTLGARYRYMWINSGNEGLDNFAAHNMVGTLAYKF